MVILLSIEDRICHLPDSDGFYFEMTDKTATIDNPDSNNCPFAGNKRSLIVFDSAKWEQRSIINKPVKYISMSEKLQLVKVF